MSMGGFTEQGCQGELGVYAPAHSDDLGAARQCLTLHNNGTEKDCLV